MKSYALILFLLLAGAGAGDIAHRPQLMNEANATTLLNSYWFVPDSALVPDHWWTLDQSSGTTIEDYGSGTDIDATITGTEGSYAWAPSKTFNSTWTGAFNRTAGEDSDDNYSILLDSNPIFDGQTKISLCMWINMDSAPGWDRFFSTAYQWSTADHVFMVGNSYPSAYIRARIRRGGTTNTYVSTEVVPNNTDVHYCFVLDFDATNELKLYKNGNSTPVWDQAVTGTELDDSGVSSPITTHISAQPYDVSGTSEGRYPIIGFIGGVELYLGKALTPSEVSTVYNRSD